MMNSMNGKLKELTDKIYLEGLEKANEKALEITTSAENSAKKIIEKAEKDAEEIILKAKKQAIENAERIETELRLSSKQALGILKKEITDLIQAKVLQKSVDAVFNDKDFMKKILETIVKNWDFAKDNPGLEVLLPSEDLKNIEKYFKENASELMNKTLSLKADDKLKTGFEIVPENGNYKISITESGFKEFLQDHFRPKIVEFLFGKDN